MKGNEQSIDVVHFSRDYILLARLSCYIFESDSSLINTN